MVRWKVKIMNGKKRTTSQFESISHFDLSRCAAAVFFDNFVFVCVIGAATAPIGSGLGALHTVQ